MLQPIDTIVLLHTETDDLTGIMVFKYRGAIVVRDGLEDGGQFVITQTGAQVGAGEEFRDIQFKSLHGACCFIDTLRPMPKGRRKYVARYFASLSGETQV
jgi:hypothetical protein